MSLCVCVCVEDIITYASVVPTPWPMGNKHHGQTPMKRSCRRLMALKKAAGKAKTVPILPAQAGGAMSDGSKRRLEAMTEEEDFALVDGHGPYGHGNWLTWEFEESQNVEDKVRGLLPEGVASFHEWGQTVFEFGKLRGTNTSYAEAMNDKKLESYLTW